MQTELQINLKNKLKLGIKEKLNTPWQHYSLIAQYTKDYLRYKKSAFNLAKQQDQENLRAKLTYYSHSIEKGLSHPNLRLYFGKKAMDNLIKTLTLYTSQGFSIEDERYNAALSTIEEYLKIHEANGISLPSLEEKLKEFSTKNHSGRGGVLEFTRESKSTDSFNSSFADLCKSRVSVREFSEDPVDMDLIYRAIEISTKTPSACNRQPWKVYIIKDEKTKDDILINQGGLTGFGNNLDTLLAVTINNRYFNGSGERNQGYIDGGMFSMTLLYALESLGLATCTLNAALNIKRDKNIRNVLHIPDHENLILFIAVGNFPEHFKVPQSARDCYTKIVNSDFS